MCHHFAAILVTWGLRSYLPADSPLKKYELGSEPTPELWAARQVKVFRELRRVLRDDGTCWVNVGDSYSRTKGKTEDDCRAGGKRNSNAQSDTRAPGYKDGDRICQGYMLAEALRRDGWYLRQTIIWAKGLAFNKYRDREQVLLWDEPELLETDAPGSVMPESTSGWRYERCQVKVSSPEATRTFSGAANDNRRYPDGETNRCDDAPKAEWQDCPGCAKCVGTLGPDLFVLRKGRWRTTSSYELLLHLAKSQDYYGDGDAVAEAAAYGRSTSAAGFRGGSYVSGNMRENATPTKGVTNTPGTGGTRNLRSVWVIPTKSYQGSHYATYPEALVVPIIKSSTSEMGVCPRCGAPWARVLQVTGSEKGSWHDHSGDDAAGQSQPHAGRAAQSRSTLSWHPTCTCGGKRKRKPIPATVLDPYAGSGTTLNVARKLARSAIGIDLDPRNEALMRRRLQGG